ncbi:hypothetical protein [Salipiger marinus]|uniref:Uncharacterized protein n=1 Tax=Salipiger marinus TaxID=555512 RepID=A0A1G8MQL1_9RHOB|nr:hypothetical protein [Salipiger marinus]SDI70204.1 hypothetical protein SAMN04487993_1008206 [Salipiger marinus]
MTDQKGSITREGGFVVIRIPEDEVHGLVVSLEPCPCRASKSTSGVNLRARIAKGLTYAMARRGS